jgi:divalent metal cation (Fe/Co/Zn/Cd) transporter
VLAAQARLYAAKSLTDLAVVTSLAAGASLGVAGSGRMIDLAGSAIVACYLIWNGAAMAAAA